MYPTVLMPYELLLLDKVLPAGKAEYGFRLPLAYIGYIKKVVVRQKSGPSTGFTINIYNRRVIESEDGPADTTYHKDLAQVTPSTTVAAGNSAILLSDNLGYAYQSHPKSPSSTEPGTLSPRGPRVLYLAISLPSALVVESTWDLAVAIAQSS